MYRGREKRMNESALEGFVKIVELNSFSAAAETLYLSQSALSQQIRTLEGSDQLKNQSSVELFGCYAVLAISFFHVYLHDHFPLQIMIWCQGKLPGH